MNRTILAVMLAVSLSSCGGSGSGGGTTITVNPSESLVVDKESYLPLSPGIITTFSDGARSEGSEVTVEGLTVSVLEDGVVKIKGRMINGDEIADVEETLEFTIDGSSIFLAGYDVAAIFSNSERANIKSSRTYTPPVLFLPDKSVIASDMQNASDGVDVAYEGEPEVVTYCSRSGAPVDEGTSSGSADITASAKADGATCEEVFISDLTDITATVAMTGTDIISIAGVDHEVFLIEFEWDSHNRELWFPAGLSAGQFGLAKGIGIVRVAGRDVAETNAIE